MGSHFYFRCVCTASTYVDPLMRGRLYRCTFCRRFVLVPEENGETATRPEFEMATERLDITLATPRDYGRLTEMFSLEENHSFDLVDPISETELRRDLRLTRFPRGFRRSRCLRFLSIERESGDPVGTVTLQLDPYYLTGTLGILIHRPFQGRGLGKEFVGAVVEFGLGTLNLQRVSAACDSKNAASIALFESLGFEREGFTRNWFNHPKRGWIDSPLFAKYHPTRFVEVG